MHKPPFRYLIGIGSNMGDRTQNLAQAVARIASTIGPVLVESPLWETAPVGPADGLFLNGAILCQSQLPPADAMLALLAIETHMGRVRKERWGNRNIDLDLLLGIDQQGLPLVMSSQTLTLPHPRMLEREFVLLPAAAIAGDWIHPHTQRSIAHAMAALS